jgi:hypothetical protein
MKTKKLMNLRTAAVRFDIPTRNLADKRFRERIGLHAIKIGRRLYFKVEDIERLIENGKK